MLQNQAVNHKNGPVLIIAGAGTGKTRVITSRIVNLINKEKVAPEKVAATIEDIMQSVISREKTKGIVLAAHASIGNNWGEI